MFFSWQNNALTITRIDYCNTKIPGDFIGFKIAHISDLHNKDFGKNQRFLLQKISEISPDIIVVTGDLIDRRKYDLDTAMVFIEGARKLAPVYYVSGNHEAWSCKYDILRKSLLDAGVKVLDDSRVKLHKGSGEIAILGLSDPGFVSESKYIDATDSYRGEELHLLSVPSEFQILLSHRPEFFDLYARENIDLTFSGHAHGGQFRLPLVGALAAPGQGLFPKYTGGAYLQNQSTLVVSRGLGNSIIPIRIFNRPEIVVVTLSNKT